MDIIENSVFMPDVTVPELVCLCKVFLYNLLISSVPFLYIVL